MITNIYEWFIFDAVDFEKAFVEDKGFLRQFTLFEEKRPTCAQTEYFYKEIAAPFIEKSQAVLPFTYFNLKDYQPLLSRPEKNAANAFIVLFKALSPERLLKRPFANDRNTLDKNFYNELLYNRHYERLFYILPRLKLVPSGLRRYYP